MRVSSTLTDSGLLQRRGCGRLYKAGTGRAILALGGATSDIDQWFALDDVQGHLSPSVDAGLPVATLSTGSTWGNSAIRASMATLKTSVQASFTATGKVHLLGTSMGGLTALNYAKYNPTLVQSICIMIPVVDVQAVYTNNRAGFAASISAAYGGAPPDADNPADNPSAFTAIPMQIYYSTTDTVTTAAETTTFAAAVGSNCELINMGAQGHFWNSQFNGTAVRDFFVGNN